MKQYYKLLVPSWIEIILFTALGLFVLIALNAKRFWLLASGNTLNWVNNIEGTDNLFSRFIKNNLDKINPHVIDFFVWIIIGCVVFVLVSVMIATIKSADDEVELIHYYQNPSSRIHEINAFLTKIAVRIVGIFGLIFWTIVFIKSINISLTRHFFVSVTTLKSPSSWLWLVMSVILYTICIYSFALLFRVIMLKPRIFSVEQE
ncbi:MAG TPA: hypothetical protein VMR51_00760 [Patescibacteria group bacterium]|nr:hypothetical protein [Patescibacteria group bacterium]